MSNDSVMQWSIEEYPKSKPYLIVSDFIKFYNKINDSDLVNLYEIDIKFKHFGWFFNRKDKQIYNFNFSLDGYFHQKQKNVKSILKKLNATSYMKIDFYLQTIKRYELSHKNIIHVINIHIENHHPEHFKLVDIKKYELPITDSIEQQPIRQGVKRRNSFDRESNNKMSNNIDWCEMISASSTRNYFLHDTLIDYIKEYNITSLDDIPSSKKGNTYGSISYEVNDPFTQFIMSEGNKFEAQVINKLKNLHIVETIAESYQSKNTELYKKTIETMKRGVPVIYQGILHDYENKTYGAPDLLIRSDYLNKFIGYDLYNEIHKSTKLGVDWHYVVVDIKHSTIPLRADKVHILNQDSIPAYKGQLLVYTTALNEILGTNISKAFIMGKKYTTNKGEINTLFNKLGTIDYNTVDEYYKKELPNALNWLRLLRKEGHNWKLLPIPSREELFPNMKNERDGIVGKIKKELALRINEITSVYFCGYEKRRIAHKQGIYSWKDEKCNSENLGFNPNSSVSKRIDSILNINRKNNDLVLPHKIQNNWDNWRKSPDNVMEFFLDYETMNSNFGTVNNSNYDDFNFVFMVGVGYENKNEQWEYKSFISENKSIEKEGEILKEFTEFIKQKLIEYKKDKAVFIHWSSAERTAYTKLQERHSFLPNKHFIDLYQVFLIEPIVVKGALNFSLKSINKALYKNGLITTTWNKNNLCMNGMSAMLLAYQLYDKNTNVKESSIMKEIEAYNEVDCKSMYEIIKYLRKYH